MSRRRCFGAARAAELVLSNDSDTDISSVVESDEDSVIDDPMHSDGDDEPDEENASSSFIGTVMNISSASGTSGASHLLVEKSLSQSQSFLRGQFDTAAMIHYDNHLDRRDLRLPKFAVIGHSESHTIFNASMP